MKPGTSDEVEVALAEHLVGDVDVAAARVLGLRCRAVAIATSLGFRPCAACRLLLVAAIVLPPRRSAAPVEPLGHAGPLDHRRGRARRDPPRRGRRPGRTRPTPPRASASARTTPTSWRANGFNVVRLGFFYRGYEPSRASTTSPTSTASSGPSACSPRAGIFTLLDFHQDQLAPRYAGRGFPDWFLLDDGLPNTAASRSRRATSSTRR